MACTQALSACPWIAVKKPALEIHRLSIGARGDTARFVFDANPGGALLLGFAPVGDHFRLVANESPGVKPDHPLQILVSRDVSRPAPNTRDLHRVVADCRRPPRQSVLSTSLTAEQPWDLARDTPHGACHDRRQHPPRTLYSGSAMGSSPLRARPGSG